MRSVFLYFYIQWYTSRYIMAKTNAEIKREFESKLAELELKRKTIIQNYKDKIREAKIEKIKKSILSK